MPNFSIPQDDLVEKLVPNAGNVETFQLFYGWVGKSTRNGYVRLYDDLDMKAYIEFSEKDLRLTESLKTADDPLGGTLVWLDADAQVITTGQKQSEVDERSFLGGDFAQAMANYESNVIIEDDIMAMATGLTRTRKCCKRPRPFKRTLFWGTCRVCCW